MTNNLSLYIHIPFCVKKCDYCAFYSIPCQNDKLKQDYFEALKRQIGFLKTEKTVSTVYFGGGTPPILGVERICDLIGFIKSRFTLSEDCEITVEINPATVDRMALRTLKKAGANRLSIGIQSANDGILKSLGRIHSFEEAKQCIFDARLEGFQNISGDVMFGLPNQSLDIFKDSVIKIAEADVDHISAYSLQLEEGTPLFNRKDTEIFPDEELEEAQYEALCDILKARGFEHYEISSFAKDGFKSRHNTAYWTRNEYFGFGAAAHSFFNGRRFSNVADVEEYIKKSYNSLLAPTDFYESEIISQEEAEEEEVLLGLRTYLGAKIPEKAQGVAKRISDLGFGSFENGVLRLNSKGFRVSNEIIAEILI